MAQIEYYFIILLILQVVQFLEQFFLGFHKKFPLFKFSSRSFIIFEILFLGFWIAVFFLKDLPLHSGLLSVFNLLMMISGVLHMGWWLSEKKYVPGLATAPLVIIIFMTFYSQMLLMAIYSAQNL